MRSASRQDLPMPPLMFEWYDTIYLGAAHGFAGILNTLLKVNFFYTKHVFCLIRLLYI